jgi:long-subunit fatty acid transport protein
MTRASLLLALAAGAAALLASPHARAGIEDTLGTGPRAMALGGSSAARPGDFASAYYNPAGLAPGGRVVERGGFFEAHLSFVYAKPQLNATSATGANLATAPTPDMAGLVVGTRFSVGRPFGVDGLDAGVALYLPPNLFKWFVRPDDDVQWALLGDRTQAFGAHAGLAYRLTRWLSLGVGVRVLFDVETTTTGQVTKVDLASDPSTGKNVVDTSTQLGTAARVFGRAAPLFGAMVTPVDAWRIGVSYRHESFVDDWGATTISGVPDLGNMGYAHRFAHYFRPSELTVATSVDLGPRVDVSVDLTWSRWSAAKSTNRNTYGDGLWGDTITPALGARVRATDALSLMGGWRWQRAPISNFGGPSNLLDADRTVPSMGLELDLGKLTGARELDARVSAALSFLILDGRTETKDFRRFPSDAALLANPGYPSYSFGGHVSAMSVGLEAKF